MAVFVHNIAAAENAPACTPGRTTISYDWEAAGDSAAGQPIMIGTMASRTPAATAEPITPATLGPIACIRR